MEPFARDYRTDHDLADPELSGRWDEVVEHLHDGCPVARSDVGEGYWVLNGYVFSAAVAGMDPAVLARGAR